MEEKRRLVRKRMVFRGQVQGVGFRWHARFSASALGLTGWVENQYDGSVIMEVQGTDEEIYSMLQELGSGRFIDIQDMEVTTIPLVEDERKFSVRS